MLEFFLTIRHLQFNSERSFTLNSNKGLQAKEKLFQHPNNKIIYAINTINSWYTTFIIIYVVTFQITFALVSGSGASIHRAAQRGP
jgi:hypothetical protein